MQIEAFQGSTAGCIQYLPGGDYWAYVPNPLPPNLEWNPDLVADLSRADRALGELAGLGRSLINPHLLIVPFVAAKPFSLRASRGRRLLCPISMATKRSN